MSKTISLDIILYQGVTYDTGGADIKAGGVMAGMHRDKCGAATVAGFMKVVSVLEPKNVRVVAGLSMVRNSVGEGENDQTLLVSSFSYRFTFEFLSGMCMTLTSFLLLE